MASFTDAISQFNPYVQQLPSELMMKVGMQKQAQYDAGVQKVQSYIDNVAGLEVANDADKAYLRSKLDELGGRLKVFSVADFSNQQLVNTVGGMTKELVADPNIQQAVASTQIYKKGTSQLNSDIASGKAKAHTTWLFNQEANKWLSSKEPGSAFNYRYQTPTADPTKKALDAIKALHPNLRELEDPFEIINGVRTGKYADVMKKYKVEGVSEGQVAQAISAVLDANDIRDLDIQGMYNFRDVDSAKLIDSVTRSYDKQKSEAERELALLRERKEISQSNPTLSNEIDKRIAEYEELLGQNGKLMQNLNNDLSKISTNPDAVKGDLYRRGFINSFANAFKWSNVTEGFETSPFEQVEQWKKDFAFKQKQEGRRIYEFEKSHRLKEKQYMLDFKKYDDERSGADMPWVDIGLDASNKRDAVNVYEGIIANQAGKAESHLNDLVTAGYTEGQIKTMINDYKKYGNKANIEPEAIGSIRDYLKEANRVKVLQDDLEERKKLAQAVTLEEHPEWMGEKRIPTYNPRTRKLEYDNVDILHQLETGKADLVVDRAPAGAIRLSFTRNDGSKGYYEIKKSEGGAQFAGASELRPILLGMVEKSKTYGENLSEQLAPYVSEFSGRVKPVKVAKSGEMPPMVERSLAAYVYKTKEQNIAANADYDPSVASQLLDSKNVKDTRVYVYNRGDDYEIVMTSLTGAAPDQRIRVNSSQVGELLGEKYVEKNGTDAIFSSLARNKRSTLNKPENAPFQVQFGDFPNVQKLQITAALKQDTKDKGLYVPVINVLKKDGKYQPFVFAGRNKMQRFGYDQGKEQLQGLSDETIIKLIRENYPTYDINLLDID